ncbi:MAG: hypothetical protein SPE43_02715 [Ruminococcus sp.]|nr:hypothetical protein [Ruminococcus sp.]
MEEESKDVGWWVKVIDVAISIPGVKVNREEFLKKELRGKVSKDVIDDAIKVGTVKAGVPKEVAEKIAENLINSKCILTSAVSFATGIPGGLVGLLGGSTVDIAQFFGNFFNLAQKLMYIYGYKDVSELDSSQTDIMIAMLGAASGVEAAQIFISKQLPKLAEKIAASLIARESAKGIFKKIADKVLVVFGKKGIALFTKGEVAKIIGKSVPLVGGLLSGALNLITFKPMANQLNKYLKENYDYHENLLNMRR